MHLPFVKSYLLERWDENVVEWSICDPVASSQILVKSITLYPVNKKNTHRRGPKFALQQQRRVGKYSYGHYYDDAVLMLVVQFVVVLVEPNFGTPPRCVFFWWGLSL